MAQYGHTLDIGRIGAEVAVYRLNEIGETEYTWRALFNSKGIEAKRTSKDGCVINLTYFDTFLYPDRVEEDELNLVDLLSGSPVKEDHDFLRLCSLLVAKYAAGHSEESFYEVIRSTLARWSEED